MHQSPIAKSVVKYLGCTSVDESPPAIPQAYVLGRASKFRLDRTTTNSRFSYWGSRVARDLTFTKKLTLTAVGMAVLALPIVTGAIGSPPPGTRWQQPSGSATPAFEVASVKPWTHRELGGVYTYPGGRVTFRGCTLHYLIEIAFNVQPFQVSGGPGWMQVERYDIDAKPSASSKSSTSMPPYPKAPPNEEQRQMLQSLLIERFQLKYHRETREGRVYLLVKGNKALKLADSKDKNAIPWAGGLEGGGIMGNGLAGRNESMEDLARRLSPYLGRPVLDRTGLSGSFDFRTEYAADDARPDVITMIFGSVQDIGLKLEASKGSVDTIVIEAADKPSAN